MGEVLTCSVEKLFPYFEWASPASNWMLFETHRAASPRPWEAGTLALSNAKIMLEPVHLPLFKPMNNPLLEARKILSRPALMMSEVSMPKYTLGTAWAFMDTESSSLTDLRLKTNSTMKPFRFMDCVVNGYAQLLFCFEFSEDYVVFMHVQELNGRDSVHTNGYIERKSRQCSIISRNENSQSCLDCIERNRLCECESLEVMQYFESKYWQRRRWIEKHLSKSHFGNEYLNSWIGGTWTARIASNKNIPNYRVQMTFIMEGKSFRDSVTFAVQGEVLSVHPPRLSQKFVSKALTGADEEIPWDDVLDSISVPEGGVVTGRENVSKQKMGKYRVRRKELTIQDKVVEHILRMSDQEFSKLHIADRQKGGIISADGRARTKHEKPLQHRQSDPNTRRHDCATCGKTFGRLNDLKRHIESVHERLRKYQCELCEKDFTHSGHLRAHFKMEHEGSRENECDQCGKTFAVKSKLQRHIKQVHSDPEERVKYPCEQCDKSYSDEYFLRKHVADSHSLGTQLSMA